MTQKRKIAKLDDTVRSLERRKRFDASKAFKHSKENVAPPASPKGILFRLFLDVKNSYAAWWQNK